MNKKSLIIFGVAIVVSAAGAIWFKENKSDQEKPKNIATENQTQQQDVEKQNNTKTESQELVDFEVPELKIKFLMGKGMSDDLIYSFSKLGNSDVIYMTTKKLLELSKYCSPEYSPVGTLSKVTGNVESYEAYKGNSNRIKQFDGFFIVYTSPQSPCLTDSAIEESIHQEYLKFFQSDEFRRSIEITR